MTQFTPHLRWTNEKVPDEHFPVVGAVPHPDGVQEAALHLVQVADGDAGEEEVIEGGGEGVHGGDGAGAEVLLGVRHHKEDGD